MKFFFMTVAALAMLGNSDTLGQSHDDRFVTNPYFTKEVERTDNTAKKHVVGKTNSRQIRSTDTGKSFDMIKSIDTVEFHALGNTQPKQPVAETPKIRTLGEVLREQQREEQPLQVKESSLSKTDSPKTASPETPFNVSQFMNAYDEFKLKALEDRQSGISLTSISEIREHLHSRRGNELPASEALAATKAYMDIFFVY